MENILISVVVPVYNVEAYLEETLESILSQREINSENIEVLLINDGSTDNSGIICDEYMKKYSDVIRVFHKENEGLLLTRRFGFAHAKGKYILNCDSDDTLEPNMLSELVGVINATDADVIIYNVNMWDGNKKTTFYSNVFTTENMCSIEKPDLLREYFKSPNVVSMCGKIFKKKCLDEKKDYMKYYKKSFGEDTLQSAEIYTKADSFIYLNKQFYNYRYGSGMTRKFNPTYYQDFKMINSDIEQYKKQWKLCDFDELFCEKLFVGVARAITQSRYNKTMTRKERYSYLKQIRNDDLVKKYEIYYNKMNCELKKSYKLFVELFLLEKYRLIDLLLRMKNFIS